MNSSFGSKIAKNGFQNELDIVDKFNKWQQDAEAKDWLEALGHNPADVTNVQALKLRIPGSEVKPDLQVNVTSRTKGFSQNRISIKLVSNLSGSNQIDKRWVETYVQMWNIPDNVASLIKQFTAEESLSISGTRSNKRVYLNEIGLPEQNLVTSFFTMNKQIVLSDIFKGKQPYMADWMMVAQKVSANSRWTIKTMDVAINYFGSGIIQITPQGGLAIGKVRVQRKGGDGGRPTANKLQFKINPAELFNI